MSIAEDIANLTANFKDKKIKETLSHMSLDEIALVWSEIQAEHEAPAKNKEAREKDFKERSAALHEVFGPKMLYTQIEAYIDSLANGTYSPADFTKISEFCESFNEGFKSDNIKNKLDEMKKLMTEKRLNMENPVTLVDDKLAKNLKLPELDSIIIEGDKEKISSLDDKTTSAGKTFSFKGEDKDMGTVTFDEQGMADITFVNENNERQHFQLTSDGTLTYLPEGKEPQSWTAEELRNNWHGRSPEMDYAIRLDNAAREAWTGYSNGKMDNAVDRSITVKEGGRSTRISEGRNKTTVNENKSATKVDEGHEEEDPLSKTTINEEQSAEKKEADLDSDTKNDKPTPEDELYWKEEDIIEAMFREWFLKAANAVTNWVVHQIEYAAAGIWNEFESALNARKAELDKKRKEEEKLDKTQTVCKKIKDAGLNYMGELKSGDSKKAKKNAIEAVKAGNVKEAIADNKLLQSLKPYANVESLLSQGNPETTVPFVTSMASMAAKFSDDYAQTSILNAQMNNPDVFKGQNMDEVYASKLQEAQLILRRQMLKHQQEHPNENPADCMFNAIQACAEDMKKAKEMSVEDFNNKRYVENGKNPRKNEILEQYESLLPPKPTREDSREDQPAPTHEDEPAPTTPTGPTHEDEPAPTTPTGPTHEDEPAPTTPTGPTHEDEPAPTTPTGPTHEDEPAPTTPTGPTHEDEPTPMSTEAERQTNIDSRIEYIRNGLQMEGADLEGRQQDVLARRQNLDKTKDFILSGLRTNDSQQKDAEQWHAPLLQEQRAPQPQQPQIKPPFKPQGRE